MSKILIEPNDRVFILTGAGISAESGLPTFRAEDGLWAGSNVEDVCTPEAWQRNPERVWLFYAARREAGFKAQPNPAHTALAGLEEKIGDRFFLCTQNVDTLHEAAGSKRLLHMHGQLDRARCERECGRAPVVDNTVYQSLSEVQRCACGGRLRPHIVFFGEIPLEMDRIQDKINQATVMIVIGTSGSVYPAAGFVQFARMNKARTIYIGPEAPLNAQAFTQTVLGKAGEVMPGIFEVRS
ncbi:SIR2 family NAD-dependent protein deacylase [Telmatobacter bradus]|uniref:SIR2 family NAD-dependent protein deacylase n=1 Tax=Telmatobacter bradus TaxID=474953 RepID=UPI003B43C488